MTNELARFGNEKFKIHFWFSRQINWPNLQMGHESFIYNFCRKETARHNIILSKSTNAKSIGKVCQCHQNYSENAIVQICKWDINFGAICNEISAFLIQ